MLNSRRLPHIPVPYRSGRKRFGAVRRVLLTVLALFLLWGFVSEWGLRSVSGELAEEACRGAVRSAVNRAVEESLALGPGSYAAAERDAEGNITAIHTDAAALAELRTAVLSRLERSLKGKAAARVSLGSLFGMRVLNGRGPKVPLRLDMEGSADVSFSSGFSSAGLNQSCYRVLMTVSVRAHSQSLRFETLVEEDSTVVLAETVLAGDAPGFLGLNKNYETGS